MQARRIHEESGQKTFVLVFDDGDKSMSGLTDFATEHELDAASLTALGAFSGAPLGYFDMEEKEYEEIAVEEQVEVISLVGTIAPKESGEPQVHAHAVVGLRDGTTRGGHLLEAHVRPTLEVVLTESPAHLRRKTDNETGCRCSTSRNRYMKPGNVATSVGKALFVRNIGPAAMTTSSTLETKLRSRAFPRLRRTRPPRCSE